jgi:hypothetical protein
LEDFKLEFFFLETTPLRFTFDFTLFVGTPSELLVDPFALDGAI